MINQHESPFYTEEAFQCQRMHKRIIESSLISKIYQAHIPSYPSGHWLFGFASKKYHPLNDLDGVSWNLRGFIQNIICRECTTESLHYRRMWRSL